MRIYLLLMIGLLIPINALAQWDSTPNAQAPGQNVVPPVIVAPGYVAPNYGQPVAPGVIQPLGNGSWTVIPPMAAPCQTCANGYALPEPLPQFPSP